MSRRTFMVPPERYRSVMLHHVSMRNGRMVTDERQMLHLPESAVYRRIRAMAEQQGTVATTADAIPRRRADMPVSGRVSVFDRDEREAGKMKPQIVLDRQPGQPDIIFFGGGAEHLGDVNDRIDTLRHYGEDALPERPNPWKQQWGSNDPTVAFHTMRDIAARIRRGARTTGALAPPGNRPHVAGTPGGVIAGSRYVPPAAGELVIARS